MSVAIKVENLSKQYRLGKVGTGTLSHDLNRWWHKLRGKEDPYLKIGESNDRRTKGHTDYVWALRDINFEIQQGEAVGIIGRNGAGKSTLLKILSRTTGPSTGNVRMKGRVASLLEVGTGFHPELTGRENIFLNGAILGMTRHEIQRKFDEIVDFSGVERYIDTPVKRYSSGMYVRLAFAVTAHLESEILIVDEVLAVGDTEFQKKCLGKMGQVSKGEGRTVLFVSHNMESIIRLCSNSLLMINGMIGAIGMTSDITKQFLRSDKINPPIFSLSKIARNNINLINRISFNEVSLISNSNEPWVLNYGDPLLLKFEIEVKNEFVNEPDFGVAIYTQTDFEIVSSVSTDKVSLDKLDRGLYELYYSFVNLDLLPGSYKLGFGIRSSGVFEDYLPNCCEFTVLISGKSALQNSQNRRGVIVPNIDVELVPKIDFKQ